MGRWPSFAKAKKSKLAEIQERLVIREELPNPNLLNYHTQRELTRAMKERHLSAEASEGWIAALLGLEGVEEVQLLRHQVRLRKPRAEVWERWTPQIEAILKQAWDEEVEGIEAEEDGERKRCFDLAPDWHVAQRQAYEGVDVAQDHPLATALFALPGVILVLLAGETLWIKRSAAYRWADIEPGLDRVLADFSTETPLLAIQAKDNCNGS